MARSSGWRNDYGWNGVSGLINGFSTANALGFGNFTFLEAGTLMRTRGEVVVGIDGPTDGDKAAVAIGIMVVSEEVRVAGAASIPGPASEAEADWLWHSWVPLQAQASPLHGDLGVSARLTIDSKAMRKFKANKALVLVAETVHLSGTPTIDLSYGLRILTAI